jgi:aminobenzoyl-glutamate transport protein
VSSASSLTFIIVLLGMISSIASDAGYLVLIPLGAAAFASVGRHPLAGIAAAFAGVAGGFGVNLLVTPTDAVLTEITNESIQLVDPTGSIDLTANLWFGIGSTIMLTVLLGMVTTRMVEGGWALMTPRSQPMPAAARSRRPTTPPRSIPRPSAEACACPGGTSLPRWPPSCC